MPKDSTCSVLGCGNTGRNYSGTFFRFPTNMDRRNSWIKFTGRTNFAPNNKWAICDKHFRRGKPSKYSPDPKYGGGISVTPSVEEPHIPVVTVEGDAAPSSRSESQTEVTRENEVIEICNGGIKCYSSKNVYKNSPNDRRVTRLAASKVQTASSALIRRKSDDRGTTSNGILCSRLSVSPVANPAISMLTDDVDSLILSQRRGTVQATVREAVNEQHAEVDGDCIPVSNGDAKARKMFVLRSKKRKLAGNANQQPSTAGGAQDLEMNKTTKNLRLDDSSATTECTSLRQLPKRPRLYSDDAAPLVNSTAPNEQRDSISVNDSHQMKGDCCHKCYAELRKDMERIESKVDQIHEMLKSFQQQGHVPTSNLASGDLTIRSNNIGSVSIQPDIPKFTTTTCSANKYLKVTPQLAPKSTVESDAKTVDPAKSPDVDAPESSANMIPDDKLGEMDMVPSQTVAPFSATCHSVVSHPIDFNNGDVGIAGPPAAADHKYTDTNGGRKDKRESTKIDASILKPVARAVLLFSGCGITVFHLKEHGPTWLSRISEKEMRIVLEHLASENILKNLGVHDVRWRTRPRAVMVPMTVYCKAAPSNISNYSLEKYGLTKPTYVAALRHKLSQYSIHLSEICDRVNDAANTSKRQDDIQVEEVPLNDPAEYVEGGLYSELVSQM